MATVHDISADETLALGAALEVLARGEPVAMPTETVYGLAADATNPTAISRIYEIKGRPQFNPLICHMANLSMAKRYADFSPLAERLAKAFWPGPLTLVLPLAKASAIHPLATAGLSTVGIRVPSGFAGRLIGAFGKPLAAPSANTSGRVSPTTAAHVADDLGDKLAAILDGGACTVGVESTIIKVDGDQLTMLRPGGVPLEEIEAVAGKAIARGSHDAAIEAPGMLASHYAPGAPVRLNAGDVEAGEVLINFGKQSIDNMDHAVSVLDLSPQGDLTEAAANLFSMLKKADLLGGRIAVATVPMHGLGEAINDRLARAAAPRE